MKEVESKLFWQVVNTWMEALAEPRHKFLNRSDWLAYLEHTYCDKCRGQHKDPDCSDCEIAGLLGEIKQYEEKEEQK